MLMWCDLVVQGPGTPVSERESGRLPARGLGTRLRSLGVRVEPPQTGPPGRGPSYMVGASGKLPFLPTIYRAHALSPGAR